MKKQVADEELLKGLLQARANKPRYYAVIVKGAAAAKVLVQKKPLLETQVQKARTAANGTDVIQGVCVGDGSDLAFEVLAEPSLKTLKLREFIDAQTDLKTKPYWKVVPQLTIVPEADDVETAATWSAKAAATTAPATKPVRPAPTAAKPTPITPTVNASSPNAEDAKRAFEARAKSVLPLVQLARQLIQKTEKQKSDAATDGPLAAELAPLAAKLAELQGRLEPAATKVKELAAGRDYAGALLELEKAATAAEKILKRENRLRWLVTAEGLRQNEPAADAALNAYLNGRASEVEVTTAQWAGMIKLGDYKVDKTLGHGGFGEAVKLVRKDDTKKRSIVLKRAGGIGTADDLRHEAEYYEKLGDHPNLPKCLGMVKLGETDGLVLEFIPGATTNRVLDDLHKRLNAGETSPEKYWGLVQFTLTRVMETLDHLQSKGVAHHDIKGDNLMFDGRTGELKMIDMGLATGDNQRPKRMHDWVATPEWFRRGEAMNVQSDVHSAGRMAFEQTEGKRLDAARPQAGRQGLMEGDNADEASDELADGRRQKKAGVYQNAAAYTEFLNWLLHPDPAQRPSPREALKHPFLRDRLLSDEAACAAVREQFGLGSGSGLEAIDEEPELLDDAYFYPEDDEYEEDEDENTPHYTESIGGAPAPSESEAAEQEGEEMDESLKYGKQPEADLDESDESEGQSEEEEEEEQPASVVAQQSLDADALYNTDVHVNEEGQRESETEDKP